MTLRLDDGSTVRYDTLVLATGARHAYFGHDAWEPFAPGLKTLEDATTIRGRILLAFEEAERQADAQKRAALMTFVIVGAGPTGVELAGTIAELAKSTLPADFRHIDTREARIVLIEAGPRVLPAFAEDLSSYAKDALERLGVEVVLGQAVSECTAEGVVFGGERLASATIIWAAGVQSSPAAQWVDAPADRVGRLKVEPDLTVPDSARFSPSVTRRSSFAPMGSRFQASRQPPSRRASMSRASSAPGSAARPRRRPSATSTQEIWPRSASGGR